VGADQQAQSKSLADPNKLWAKPFLPSPSIISGVAREETQMLVVELIVIGVKLVLVLCWYSVTFNTSRRCDLEHFFVVDDIKEATSSANVYVLHCCSITLRHLYPSRTVGIQLYEVALAEFHGKFQQRCHPHDRQQRRSEHCT
jgi:hypothetical protein